MRRCSGILHVVRIVRDRSCLCRLYGRGGRYGGEDKFASYVARPPQAKTEPAWHRLAKDIKNFDTDNLSAAQVRHLSEIRKGYDPHDTIPKLEEEIQGEIAYALSKTGSKVTILFRELHKLDEAVENAHGNEKAKLIKLFNEVRQMAYDARRDLIIHRQAVGKKTARVTVSFCIPNFVCKFFFLESFIASLCSNRNRLYMAKSTFSRGGVSPAFNQKRSAVIVIEICMVPYFHTIMIDEDH